MCLIILIPHHNVIMFSKESPYHYIYLLSTFWDSNPVTLDFGTVIQFGCSPNISCVADMLTNLTDKVIIMYSKGTSCHRNMEYQRKPFHTSTP